MRNRPEGWDSADEDDRRIVAWVLRGAAAAAVGLVALGWVIGRG